MKAFVVFLITLNLYYANSFEYHEKYNPEDVDGRSLDEYRESGEESFSYYEPVITRDESVPFNNIPDEASLKPLVEFHIPTPEEKLIPAVTTPKEIQQDSKKPYYDEKDAPKLFQKFMKDFSKQYKDEEEYNKRYQNFIKNLKDINKLNKEEETTFEINMFADLGEGEPVIG